MMRKILIPIILLIWTTFGWAQLIPNLGGQRVGTSAAQFLKIGVGARAIGMGEAFVSIANDAEALYWNPAGISQFSKNALLASHVQWLVDIKLEYAGAVYHLDPANSFGIAITYLHTDEMMETTELMPLGTGRTFSFGDFMVALTYARNMTDKFSFGITAKVMQENIAELTMRAFLFDLGTYYKTGWRSIRFAVAVTNFGSDIAPTGTVEYINLQNEKVTVTNFQSFSPPTMFRIGIAMELVETENYKLTSSVQLDHPNDNKENINFGLEYWWNDMFALRAGYKTARVEENFSAGFGVRLPLGSTDFRLDYAFTNFGRLGYVNRFAMQFYF
ncbi:MAG: PorV/PorQ family protein [Calditrichaeota bacterium]|nr:PorV/PorQ family protein [Calditrichota bacterium]